jgi:diguanylate cyclase (GGDEF)-like protein
MRAGLRPQKLLAASGARVAPGGESGWFQLLVPALVVIVVLFAALTVRSEADHASEASTTATRAQAFRAAVRETAALQEAVRASRGDNARIKAQARQSLARMSAALAPLEQTTGGDPDVESLARMATSAEKAPTLTPLTSAADALVKRFDENARTTAESAHQHLTLTLIGGAVLAALMLWSFFSKRARASLERIERHRDVERQRALEEQIHHQAFHDSLTGLANRALFEDRLNHALERLRRDERQGAAVVFIDLDDFKTVNDSLGHAAGDDLLRAFAGCLADCTRRADTVARFGGDEFAVLVEGFMADDAAAVIADRIHAALEEPIRLEQDDVYVHASVGIASGDVALTADEVVRNADLAMYSAKADGKGQSAFFEPSMHSAARKRLQLTGDLRRALGEGQLSINYQPLIRLDDGRMLGAEALLRWAHPEHGLVPPAEFIPLAEESGLILSIGSYVLNEACRQLKVWQSEHPGNHPDYISVNLSVRQFQREGHVVEEVRSALEQAGIEGSNLMLEITESVLMEDRQPIIRDLDAVRKMGVRIAIDDFGTGYSALSYLREFPIDTVKMDRSFVHNLGQGSADSALVRSVVELGEALDMQIIAEGIEVQGQLDSVTGLRCDIGQGYFFAPPLDPDAMRNLLNGEAPPPEGYPESPRRDVPTAT